MKAYVTTGEVEKVFQEVGLFFQAWKPQDAATRINEYLINLFDSDYIDNTKPELEFPLFWLTFFTSIFPVNKSLIKKFTERVDRSTKRCDEISEIISKEGHERVEPSVLSEFDKARLDNHWLQNIDETIRFGSRLFEYFKDYLISISPKLPIAEQGALWGIYFEAGDIRWRIEEGDLEWAYLRGIKNISEQIEAKAGEILAYLDSRKRHSQKKRWQDLYKEVLRDRDVYESVGNVAGVKWKIEEKYRLREDNIGLFLFKYAIGDQPWSNAVEKWRKRHTEWIERRAASPQIGRPHKHHLPCPEVIIRHARLLYDAFYPRRRLISPVWENILYALIICYGFPLYYPDKWRSFRSWVTYNPDLWRGTEGYVKIGGRTIKFD